jgi:uncharacterized protein
MDSESTERELSGFISRLNAEIQPELVLLFGSRARGDSRPNSDYDLIIVADKFQGMRWRDRISCLIKIWNRNDAVDLIPYTHEEFEDKRKDFITVQSAVNESVQLFPTRTH